MRAGKHEEYLQPSANPGFPTTCTIDDPCVMKLFWFILDASDASKLPNVLTPHRHGDHDLAHPQIVRRDHHIKAQMITSSELPQYNLSIVLFGWLGL